MRVPKDVYGLSRAPGTRIQQCLIRIWNFFPELVQQSATIEDKMPFYQDFERLCTSQKVPCIGEMKEGYKKHGIPWESRHGTKERQFWIHMLARVALYVNYGMNIPHGKTADQRYASTVSQIKEDLKGLFTSAAIDESFAKAKRLNDAAEKLLKQMQEDGPQRLEPSTTVVDRTNMI